MSQPSACCAPTAPTPAAPPAPSPAPDRSADPIAQEWIPLPGGRFLMGTNDPEAFPADAESPPRPVEISPFAIAATAVTNAAFEPFVRATGYRTVAEQFGWSFVFHLQVPAAKHKKSKFQKKVPGLEWWLGVKGASWHRPEGPGSSLEGRMDHPVVHIAWFDAVAYCRWAGFRLPTEAEWEFAARGRLEQKKFPWGEELMPGGRHRGNIWQGKFPHENLGDDAYRWTAPVRAFVPNGFGLHNVCGNVWEWCADWFAPSWPQPVAEDYRGPLHAERRVIRGGSFLCHRSYCIRYRVGARSSNTPDSTTSHCGFRVARDA